MALRAGCWQWESPPIHPVCVRKCPWCALTLQEGFATSTVTAQSGGFCSKPFSIQLRNALSRGVCVKGSWADAAVGSPEVKAGIGAVPQRSCLARSAFPLQSRMGFIVSSPKLQSKYLCPGGWLPVPGDGLDQNETQTPSVWRMQQVLGLQLK